MQDCINIYYNINNDFRSQVRISKLINLYIGDYDISNNNNSKNSSGKIVIAGEFMPNSDVKKCKILFYF